MILQTVDKLIAECGSWDDLWAKLTTQADENSLSQTQKGDVFERLTQLYLQTVPEYQSILKHVWWLKYDELPAKVRHHVNLPSLDEGIDLVAETRQGEYWAIQSKFRSDTNKALTYKELSTFTTLSFVTCKNISLALVAHTANKTVFLTCIRRNYETTLTLIGWCLGGA